MLKFINEKGKLRYVLFDDDTQPREVETLTKKVLKDLGITIDDNDESKSKAKTSGVSQNDLQYIIGE